VHSGEQANARVTSPPLLRRYIAGTNSEAAARTCANAERVSGGGGAASEKQMTRYFNAKCLAGGIIQYNTEIPQTVHPYSQYRQNLIDIDHFKVKISASKLDNCHLYFVMRVKVVWSKHRVLPF
jgi:hypothetical protein